VFAGLGFGWFDASPQQSGADLHER